jgi:hypothetical protein
VPPHTGAVRARTPGPGAPQHQGASRSRRSDSVPAANSVPSSPGGHWFRVM